MNLKKQSEIWVKEGLIDEKQATSILEFESQSPNTPWAIYGVAGIGITVIMTGIISLIAANWNDLSDSIKLTCYFLTASILALINLKLEKKPGILRELLLTGYALFFLAGIGLIGQIYNLNSESYRALLFWTCLTLPISLLSKGRLVPHIWFAGLYLTMFLWISNFPFIDQYKSLLYCLGIVYLSLAGSYGFSNLVSENFTKTCRSWAVVVALLGGGIFANFLWSSKIAIKSKPDIFPNSLASLMFCLISLCIACSIIFYRKKDFPKSVSLFISLSLISSSVLIIPPLIFDLEKNQILGCILFITTWSFVAIASVLSNRKRLFDFVALIIGIRFVVIYFEVFGSLTATGFGLILSGIIILFAVYCWHKYRAKIAALIREQI